MERDGTNAHRSVYLEESKRDEEDLKIFRFWPPSESPPLTNGATIANGDATRIC